MTNDEIVRYFDRNLDVLKKCAFLCGEGGEDPKDRRKSKKTNLLTNRSIPLTAMGSLPTVRAGIRRNVRIFIVEGDSAGGSAKTARERMYQAILPIRGKILNVEKASIDKVLANAEIKTMINAFDAASPKDMEMTLILRSLGMTRLLSHGCDDGAHISTLLFDLFYRFMPELIFEGHVYIAMPLYKGNA